MVWRKLAPARPLDECCNQRTLGARLKPGEGLAKRFLYLSQGCFILVVLPGPEEPFEAILAVAGDEMDMHMGDALADAVVEGNKRAIGG